MKRRGQHVPQQEQAAQEQTQADRVVDTVERVEHFKQLEKKYGAKCRACKKNERDCVLPCKNAVSAFTEDERFARWLAHVCERLQVESDRLDPEHKHPGGIVAHLDNATRNLIDVHVLMTGKWPT